MIWLLCWLGFHKISVKTEHYVTAEGESTLTYTQTCTRPSCLYVQHTTYDAPARVVCLGCWEYAEQCQCNDSYWREFYK